MKYCAECGTQLNDDERFCSNCGMPVSDDTETGVDGAEAPKSTEETAQPVPANESQEQPNTAEASAPEQSNEPGNGNKPPADKKSGYIGCIVLIFLVVVLFKGCGMLFGDSEEDKVAKEAKEWAESGAQIAREVNGKDFFANTKVEKVKVDKNSAVAVVLFEEGNAKSSQIKRYRRRFYFLDLQSKCNR